MGVQIFGHLHRTNRPKNQWQESKEIHELLTSRNISIWFTKNTGTLATIESQHNIGRRKEMKTNINIDQG